MDVFQFWGLLFVALLLAPNLIFARTHPDGFANCHVSKTLETLEQIGRFGCFGLMIFQLPGLCPGYWFPGAQTVYLAAGGALLLLYELGWIVFWRESSLRKALVLSILPSLLFLESGIVTGNAPLTAAALLFAPCHILISCRNAVAQAGKTTDRQEKS